MSLRTVVLSVTLAFSASASATTLTFNELAPGAQLGLSYEADGYTLTGTPRFSFPSPFLQFYVPTGEQAYWTGSPGLIMGGVASHITFNSSRAALFDALSIDLSRADSYGSLIPVSFVGVKGDGSKVVATYQFTDRLLGRNDTFVFGDAFRSLRALQWQQGAEYHQFDNIVVAAVSTVPEPSTMALFMPLLVGLPLWCRKRTLNRRRAGQG